MAFVLALVIVGWLVAFALGSQVWGERKSTITAKPSPVVVKATKAKPETYREPVSAA